MIIDIIIAAVLFLSALIAFFRGFVREVLTLCGFVGALLIAFFISPRLQTLTHGWFDVEEGSELFGIIPTSVAIDVGTFAFVFLVALVVLTLIAHAISHGLHAVGLGALDRTLGVLFGLLRGLFLILVFYLPFYFTSSATQKEGWFEKSATLPIVDLIAMEVEPYLPIGDEEDGDTSKDEEKQNKNGFNRLDDVMRNALEAEDKGDEPPPQNTSQGYDLDDLKSIGIVIEESLTTSETNKTAGEQSETTTKELNR